MEKKISNKRILADLNYEGENIMIGGSVELDASGALVNLNGTVFEKESLKQIGDCRLTTINLWKAENVSYRTEISTLIDEITTAINNGTIEEV